jgi:hypothetical protein
MRLGILVICVIAAGALGACSSAAPTRSPTWAEVAAGLKPALEPHSTNPCQRGDVRCVDLVIAELRRRDSVLASSCDHRALFARVYLRTTEKLRSAARAGQFRDRAAIVHFGAWFARYHFQADDAWRAGRRTAVPGAWRAAFSAAADRSVHGLGDLLLGMNAHITRDLAFSVADLEQGRGRAVDPDFALFTKLIETKSVAVVAELATRFDPGLRLAQVPLTLGGRRSLGRLIGLWRTEAWRNGIALRDAHGPARAAAARRIESTARLRAGLIVAGTAYLPLVESSRSRDAYCVAHAGG